MLGIEYPVISAGMGPSLIGETTGAPVELVVAVSEAGGLGVLGAAGAQANVVRVVGVPGKRAADGTGIFVVDIDRPAVEKNVARLTQVVAGLGNAELQQANVAIAGSFKPIPAGWANARFWIGKHKAISRARITRRLLDISVSCAISGERRCSSAANSAASRTWRYARSPALFGTRLTSRANRSSSLSRKLAASSCRSADSRCTAATALCIPS